MIRKNGITLIELLIVVSLIGILATFAIPGYWGVRARTEQRTADAMLRLIYAAERVRFLEVNSYVACASTALCNAPAALGLELPTGAAGYSYAVTVPVAGDTFLATATPGTGGGAIRTITQTGADPVTP